MAELVLDGQAGSQFGACFSLLGDVNEDGYQGTVSTCEYTAIKSIIKWKKWNEKKMKKMKKTKPLGWALTKKVLVEWKKKNFSGTANTTSLVIFFTPYDSTVMFRPALGFIAKILRPVGGDPGVDRPQKDFFWRFVFLWVNLAVLNPLKVFREELCGSSNEKQGGKLLLSWRHWAPLASLVRPTQRTGKK